MTFWNWLWGKAKRTDEIGGTPFTSPAGSMPPPTVQDGSGPQMTSIRVSMPSLVRPVFSIQTAIELMRTLPFDENPELVLRVLRKTLRSTGVEVEEVIRSAKDQEDALVGAVATDRAAIELLEQQIRLRNENIARLESELSETREVRQRLEEAMEGETKVGPALDPNAVLRIRAEAEKADAKKAPPPTPAGPKRVPVPPPKLPSAHAKPSSPPARKPITSSSTSVLAPPAPSPSTSVPAPGASPSTSMPAVTASAPSATSASSPPSPARPDAAGIADVADIDDAFSERTEQREVPSIAPSSRKGS